ncbi:MAG: sialidase family protein [Bryobacteraceae bacterium]
MNLLLVLAAASVSLMAAADLETGAVKRSDGAAFFSNAIPQVSRLGDGRLLAVWRVQAKGSHDARVVGAFSADGARTWSEPKTLIDHRDKDDGDANMLVDGSRVWVYCTTANIPNKIDKSWTYAVHSKDNGATWSEAREIFIPRQYTPGKQHNAIKLADGTYMMGISWDLWPERGMAARTEGEMNLSSGVLLSKDGFQWTLHGDIHAFMEKVRPGATNGLCEPSIVQLADASVLMILRSGGSRHWESRSRDGGVTWSDPQPSALPGSNTPTALWRLRRGTNEIVAVWNNSPTHRFPLGVAMSRDGGKTFSRPRILAPGDGYQVSYPGITELEDGTLVAVWQQQLPEGGRDIRWARFRPEWIIE